MEHETEPRTEQRIEPQTETKPLIELLIMSRGDISTYNPPVPTYVIQISSSFDPAVDPLIDSEFYTRRHYIFDDNDHRFKAGPVFLDDHIAQAIVSDFQSNMAQVQALIVQCSLGRNRSPAVAIALNDLFSLGYDSEILKKQYPVFNRAIYDKIIE